MRPLHEQFMNEVVVPMVLDKGRDALAQHTDTGDTVIIITATNDFVTGPIARMLGVDILIATQAEVVAGRYTGDIVGVPSYASGKVQRLKQWLIEHNRDLAGSVFYSDSHNDIPLLETVEYAVCVDPDDTLRRHAEDKAWPVISFRS